MLVPSATITFTANAVDAAGATGGHVIAEGGLGNGGGGDERPAEGAVSEPARSPKRLQSGKEVHDIPDRVLRARDGDEALALIRSERPALVLLDVMMPRKSGFEVCQAVRADEALAGVKILMLTAKGRDTDLAQGLGVGADGYMTKPFSTKELAARVREMLGA